MLYRLSFKNHKCRHRSVGIAVILTSVLLLVFVAGEAQSADYITLDDLVTFNSLISDNFTATPGPYITLDFSMMNRNYALQKHTTTLDIKYYVEDIIYKGAVGTTIEYNGGRTNVVGGQLGFRLQSIIQSTSSVDYKLWLTALNAEPQYVRQTMMSLMSRTYVNSTAKVLTTIVISTTGSTYKMVIERIVTY